MTHWPTSEHSGFYKLSVNQRLEVICAQTGASPEDLKSLSGQALPPEKAMMLIENFIGLFDIPIGVALNLCIDGKDVIVPMAVEETSVIAGISHAAKAIRKGGGSITTTSTGDLMIFQVAIRDVPDFEEAKNNVIKAEQELLDLANKIRPGMLARGGGAKKIEFREVIHSEGVKFAVIHLIVDVCDSMGANVGNTMAEYISPRVVELCGGKSLMNIVSNYATERVVSATVVTPLSSMEVIENPGKRKGIPGPEVCKEIEYASLFAEADPHRAATHNKGIMNGIDPVLIATGNDWRAVEAGAHAYASRNGQYSSLATWRVLDDMLVGDIEMPMQVGIVGGITKIHPAVRTNNTIMGIRSADQLARVIVALGLVQNLAALKALVTDGIQKGHMTLHARNFALGIGANPGEATHIGDQMIREGNISETRAREILAEIRKDQTPAS